MKAVEIFTYWAFKNFFFFHVYCLKYFSFAADTRFTRVILFCLQKKMSTTTKQK